ncbi:MAG: hypothetical protein IH795_03980, partial [Bacteroidetes bacterium]|nr:hypothetical protein [Bacteroidota bacterium]
MVTPQGWVDIAKRKTAALITASVVSGALAAGATIVLPDGEIARLGSGSTPRPAGGWDLIGLFTGCEGTFGIATEIEVRLLPIAKGVRTLLGIFDTMEDAGRAVTAIMASGLMPAAIEIVDQATIRALEASVFAAGYPVDAGAALVVAGAGSGARRPIQAILGRQHRVRHTTSSTTVTDEYVEMGRGRPLVLMRTFDEIGTEMNMEMIISAFCVYSNKSYIIDYK